MPSAILHVSTVAFACSAYGISSITINSIVVSSVVHNLGSKHPLTPLQRLGVHNLVSWWIHATTTLKSSSFRYTQFVLRSSLQHHILYPSRTLTGKHTRSFVNPCVTDVPALLIAVYCSHFLRSAYQVVLVIRQCRELLRHAQTLRTLNQNDSTTSCSCRYVSEKVQPANINGLTAWVFASPKCFFLNYSWCHYVQPFTSARVEPPSYQKACPCSLLCATFVLSAAIHPIHTCCRPNGSWEKGTEHVATAVEAVVPCPSPTKNLSRDTPHPATAT